MPPKHISPGIVQAINVLGGMPQLALKLGVTRQAVRDWVLRGYPPLARVDEIAALTGVSRLDLLDPEIIRICKEEGLL